jgi:hypothetical protein
MKRLQTQRFILPLLFLGIFTACNPAAKQQGQAGQGDDATLSSAETTLPEAVDPALAGIDVPYISKSFDAAKAQTLTFASGTVIEIPANALRDSDGNIVKGDVTLKFREFRDASDIIASGIIMHDPRTGQYLQTAGMFDIQAEQSGKVLEVAKGQAITVHMASDVPGNEYDFLVLRTQQCKWETLAQKLEPSSLTNGKPVVTEAAMLEDKGMMKPKRAKSDDLVFDIDVNYSIFPELKTFHGVVWQYAGTDPKLDPAVNPSVFETDWTSAEIKKTDKAGIYRLELAKGTVQQSLEVQPVLRGEDYKKALAAYEKKMAKYEKQLSNRLQEVERQQSENAFRRTFAVNEFGIFNWDYWKNTNRVVAEASFDIEGLEENNYTDNISYFVVETSRKAVVRYNSRDLENFSFSDTNPPYVLAILPGNELAFMKPEAFKQLNISKIQATGKVKLALQRKPGKIESLAQLQDVIDEIML